MAKAQARQGATAGTSRFGPSDFTARQPMKMLCYKLQPDPAPMVPGRSDRDWMDAFPDRHAYRCLPLSMANSSGWELLVPHAFSLHWNGGPAMEDLTIEVHGDAPGADQFCKSHFSRGIATMHTGWLFRTEPGWGLWVMGPPNAPKDGIAPLSGLIETDWLPYSFTMNWMMTRPGTVRFEAGEPFCFITPVPHNRVEQVLPIVRELDEDPALKAQHDAFRDTRDDFNARMKGGCPVTAKEGWQKFYFLGKVPDHPDVQPDHVNKRRLLPPLAEDPIPDAAPLEQRLALARQVADMIADAGSRSRGLKIEFIGISGDDGMIDVLGNTESFLSEAEGDNLEKDAVGAEAPSLAAPSLAVPSLAAPALSGHNSDPHAGYRLLEAHDPESPVYAEADFLDAATCRQLIEAFERNTGDLVRVEQGRPDSIWDNRLLWITSFTDRDRAVKRIMQDSRARILQRLAAHFHLQDPLYNDTIQLVRWQEGMDMPVHSDNSDLEGAPNDVPHRHYSAVVYLNDDYEGGDFVMPAQKLRVRPKAGLLVAFPAGLDFAHGVLKVERGTRYTMPGWYTHDREHADRSFFEIY